MTIRPAHILPLALFVLVALLLAVGLTLNPREIPSALIGKPVPQFALEPLYEGEPPFAEADLNSGEPVLVNVFASWCIPCRAEHPVLMNLAARGVTIYGLNYKDELKDAHRFLATLGNSYAKTGRDPEGKAGFEWGVYGVPETFVVTGDGRIVAKYISPLTPTQVEEEILPMLKQLGWEAP